MILMGMISSFLRQDPPSFIPMRSCQGNEVPRQIAAGIVGGAKWQLNTYWFPGFPHNRQFGPIWWMAVPETPH